MIYGTVILAVADSTDLRSHVMWWSQPLDHFCLVRLGRAQFCFRISSGTQIAHVGSFFAQIQQKFWAQSVILTLSLLHPVRPSSSKTGLFIDTLVLVGVACS